MASGAWWWRLFTETWPRCRPCQQRRQPGAGGDVHLVRDAFGGVGAMVERQRKLDGDVLNQ
jgi:hypothetical protein